MGSRAGRTYAILSLLYLGFVIYGSLVPLAYRHVPWEEALRRFRDIPYLDLPISRRGDLVFNLLLFIPLTFFALGAVTRGGQRRFPWLLAALLLLLAAGLSVAIEFGQIFFPPHTVSQNDMYVESAGAVVGAVVWFGFGRRITRWFGEVWGRRSGGAMAAKVLAGYLVLVILYQLLPFDLTIRPAELYHKLKGQKTTLVPFTDVAGLSAHTLVSEATLLIPVGFFLGVMRRRGQVPSRRGGVVRGLAVGFGFAALLEMGQLFVFSRYASTTDVLLGGLGAWTGYALACGVGPAADRPWLQSAGWLRWGPAVRLGALLVWVGALAWHKWVPFDFHWPADLGRAVRGFFAVPFLRQYYGSEFLNATRMVREFVCFVVLGLLAGSFVAGSRAGAKWAVAALVALVAIAMEFAQVFLPRVADMTAALLAATAGVIGVRLFDWFHDVFVATRRDARPGRFTAGPC